MTRAMITVECEWKMRTPLGFDTDCKADFDVWRDFDDAETVRAVVKWCRKAVTTESIREPMITFIFGDGSPYGVSTGRVFGWFGGAFSKVKWVDGSPDVTDNIKPTAKLFRELYMACLERLKKEVGVNEE